jgi:hypothetical protein
MRTPTPESDGIGKERQRRETNATKSRQASIKVLTATRFVPLLGT